MKNNKFLIFFKGKNLPYIYLFEMYCKKSGKRKVEQFMKVLHLYFDEVGKKDRNLLKECLTQVEKDNGVSEIYERLRKRKFI